MLGDKAVAGPQITRGPKNYILLQLIHFNLTTLTAKGGYRYSLWLLGLKLFALVILSRNIQVLVSRVGK